MSDRIVLINMRFEGRHGVLGEERLNAQPFEVDVELGLDLAPAGSTDDLSQTIDYRVVFGICRDAIEGPSVRLIEALAERIAARLLAAFEPAALSEVVVRVRKPRVMLPGALDGAAVEITRRPPPRTS
ncbi:MAG: dihydroneopterin aldolase [Candidatus Limnocylindrales bacterium]